MIPVRRNTFAIPLLVSTALHALLAALLFYTPSNVAERHSSSRHITFNFKQVLQKQKPVPQQKSQEKVVSKKKHTQEPLKKPVIEKTLTSSQPKAVSLPEPQPVEAVEPVPKAKNNPVMKKRVENPAAESASAPDSRALAEQKRAIDEFLAQILCRIEQAKRYPRAARRRGVTGTVTCRFVIARDGTLQSAEVHSAARHAALNRAALAAIRNGAPYPEFPSYINGETFSSLVDIVFKIK